MTAVAEPWIEVPLRQFVEDARVSLVIMCHTSGQVLGQAGFASAVDVMAACALAAAIHASASELGRMLDHKPFAGLHQSNRSRQATLMTSETRRGAYLLLTVFDDSTSVGLVRLYFEELRQRLAEAAPPPELTPRIPLAENFERDLNRNLSLMFGRTA